MLTELTSVNAYRPEIDGLRALAILPVIFFHAGASWMQGGFVGVDVFFVISGLLISTILIRDLEAGRFSILRFYERRIRRIMPALLVMMLVVTPVAFWLLVPSQLVDFSQSIIATLAFLSNVLFWIESGYFEADAEMKPLLHTWSLAVEEQYYFFFPVYLFLIWRFGLVRVLLLTTLLAIASLFYASFASRKWPEFSFYLLPSRIWELLVGVLAAIMILRGGVRRSQLLSSFGLLCLLLSLFVLDGRNMPWPSWNTLLPVGGTFLVVVFAGEGTWVHRILSSRGLVFVGLISYSAYLWHQPLIVFWRMHSGAEHGDVSLIMVALLALPLAWLSWKFVEQPFRKPGVVSNPAMLFTLGAMVLLLAGFSVQGLRSDGFYEAKYAAISEEGRAYLFDIEEVKRHIDTTHINEQRTMWEPFSATSGKERVLVIGDSVSFDSTMSLMTTESYQTRLETRRAMLDNNCVEEYFKALDSQRVRFSTEACELHVTDLLQDDRFEHADHIVLHAMWRREDYHWIRPLIAYLLEQGKRVSVMTLLTFRSVDSLVMRPSLDAENIEHYMFLNRRSEDVLLSDRIREIVDEFPGVRFYPVQALFCDEVDETCINFDDDNYPLIWDQAHMTPSGWTQFGERMFNAGWFLNRNTTH